jgi:Zn-dependent metalloprotease
VQISHEVRGLRSQASQLSRVALAFAPELVEVAPAPAITIFDCKKSQNLPGLPLASPQDPPDETAQRASDVTAAVADFFREAFGRNSIDDHGMTMMSSIHFGFRYNNAMWNGSQMVFGDGDGRAFLDFTHGADVVAHELTHGVIQHSAQLTYAGESGGLNESIADCFASMFRQWHRGQDVTQADWLIGTDILGPAAQAQGFACLRDLADPTAKHCLGPQLAQYSQLKPEMDPHDCSGPANLAFATACRNAGGKSWESVGPIWYRALTGYGATPDLTMKQFADRTRQVAHTMDGVSPAVADAIDGGWASVGL